jgi:hypothetical protein
MPSVAKKSACRKGKILLESDTASTTGGHRGLRAIASSSLALHSTPVL